MDEANEMFAAIYRQNHSTINGRQIFHYLINTSIGQFNIIEYEQRDLALKRYIIDGDYEKSEKKYDQLCIQMIKGNI